MKLTPRDIQLHCDCGRKHEMSIQKIIIKPGAMRHITDDLPALGVSGNLIAIYDENTYAATAGRHPQATQEIILNSKNLHADEVAVENVMRQINLPTGALIAIGSGTIHDTTRYCAAQLGVPFLSVPTAASVDGFASTVCAMTWYGFKTTMPGIAPTAVFADLDILSTAPRHLTLSGFGDLVGKYTCLADWEISHCLTGEYYCEGIANLTRSAVDTAVRSRNELLTSDPEAYEHLIYGLLLSGIAMQLASNSRPASGAEHHISHILEFGLWGENTSLHGEKVGAATPLVAASYHDFAKMSADELKQRINCYSMGTVSHASMERVFGRLADGVIKENTNCCLSQVDPDLLVEKWDEVCRLIKFIPQAEIIHGYLTDVKAKHTMEDIGVDSALVPALLYWSPFVRNRLTLMRIAHLFTERGTFYSESGK